MAVRMDSGIEVHTMTVARQDPSNNSTMRPTNAPASQHFMEHIGNRILDEGGGVVEEPDLAPPPETISSARGIIFLIPSTTSRVEASVLFMTTMMTVCLPFTSTAFCCTRPMSCTEATSRR